MQTLQVGPHGTIEKSVVEAHDEPAHQGGLQLHSQAHLSACVGRELCLQSVLLRGRERHGRADLGDAQPGPVLDGLKTGGHDRRQVGGAAALSDQADEGLGNLVRRLAKQGAEDVDLGRIRYLRVAQGMA